MSVRVIQNKNSEYVITSLFVNAHKASNIADTGRLNHNLFVNINFFLTLQILFYIIYAMQILRYLQMFLTIHTFKEILNDFK